MHLKSVGLSLLIIVTCVFLFTFIKVKDKDWLYVGGDLGESNGFTASPSGTHNAIRRVQTSMRSFVCPAITEKEVSKPLVPSHPIQGAIIFRDDFNTFDLNQWRFELSMYGGMNGEFQVYTDDRKNVFTRNGKLYIKPTLTVDDPRFGKPNFLYSGKMNMISLFGSCTNSANMGCYRQGKDEMLPPVMSGKIKSIPSIRYGVVEVRARIPKGDWLWPAIWMIPRDKVYGGWPRSGEIDIMEARGNAGGLGVGAVSSTLHWGPSVRENRFQTTRGSRHAKTWADDFHTYKLEWTPSHIATYVDGHEIMNIEPGRSFWSKGRFEGDNIWSVGDRMAPFDKEFYVVLNVAVGGTNGFFPDRLNYESTNKPWSNDQKNASSSFWNARGDWLKTWNGDDVALVIDYIEMRSWF